MRGTHILSRAVERRHHSVGAPAGAAEAADIGLRLRALRSAFDFDARQIVQRIADGHRLLAI